MHFTARLLLLLAVFSFQAGCSLITPRTAAVKQPPAPLPAGALIPSPGIIIGRVVAIDAARRFAFVELAPDAPTSATAEGADLVARTLDLRETARLQASRYLRGRTLGTHIVSGQPTPGDEVVWLAP